jgi:hypothetical protein
MMIVKQRVYTCIVCNEDEYDVYLSKMGRAESGRGKHWQKEHVGWVGSTDSNRR